MNLSLMGESFTLLLDTLFMLFNVAILSILNLYENSIFDEIRRSVFFPLPAFSYLSA